MVVGSPVPRYSAPQSHQSTDLARVSRTYKCDNGYGGGPTEHGRGDKGRNRNVDDCASDHADRGCGTDCSKDDPEGDPKRARDIRVDWNPNQSGHRRHKRDGADCGDERSEPYCWAPNR